MVALVLSGLLIGVAMGWVLQRGRYCMNSAFRDLIFINDYTLFKAYILALLVIIIGANALEDIGQIEELRRQAFVPFANILGGYIFGLGIVLAGGCGSGIWYRVGEGMFAAWVAVLGFMIGIFTTKNGVLRPVYDLLTSVHVWQTEEGIKLLNDAALEEIAIETHVPTLYNLIGVNKWVVIGVLVAAAVPFLVRGAVARPKKGYSWPVAGLLIGIVITAAWWASEKWGGGARGVSYTGPTAELFKFLILGRSSEDYTITWSALLVLGTPIGALLSAKGLKEFKLKAPGAEELLRVFVGGLIMGLGATLAGG